MKVVEHHSLEHIEALFLGAQDVRFKTNLHIILLGMKGHNTNQIAALLSIGQSTTWNRIDAYNALGLEALIDKRANNGKTSHVTDEEIERLCRTVEQEPAPRGGRWTGRDVVLWVQNTLNKTIALSTAYKYLHRAKLSLQRPRPQDVRGSQEEQELFKKDFRSKWKKSGNNTQKPS